MPVPASLHRALSGAAVSLSLLAFAALSVVSAPAAHAQVVAPSAYAATEAPGAQFAPTQVAGFTYQVQYAASQLTSLTVGQRISGISFRLDSDAAAQTLSYANYNVQLSQAANALANFSTTFASNALNPVTVYNAPLTFLASDQPVGGSPNTFGLSVVFSSFYAYQGGDLVLTIRHVSSSTGTDSGVGLDADIPNASLYRAQFTPGPNVATASAPDANVVVTRFNTATNAAAPEPGTIALLMAAGVPVVGIVRRRKACKTTH